MPLVGDCAAAPRPNKIGVVEPDSMVVVLLLLVVVLAAASLVCFSWASRIDVSSSCKRVRSQSTVKLSTVSTFGCSLPSESSIRVSSNWNAIGAAGDVLLHSAKESENM